MANQDRPYGFRFAMTTHGGEPRITKMLSDGSAAIYPGDLVKKETELVKKEDVPVAADLVKEDKIKDKEISGEVAK